MFGGIIRLSWSTEVQAVAFHADEDLIKHILTDGQNFFPQADESEMADL